MSDPRTIDGWALERGRLRRLRREIDRAGCAAALFYDPVNIRYTTGVSNMQVYSLHNACRYVFVPAVGPVVLFEFRGAEHLAATNPTIGDVRPALSWYDFVAGSRWRRARRALGGGDRRAPRRRPAISPSIDSTHPGVDALRARGIRLHDGQRVANRARVVKTPEERAAIRAAVAACEAAIGDMGAALAPGVTENELWAELHRGNIARGGEWVETRLLTSGPRTNPWYQECSDRVIHDGDLVAFDTDLVGVGGYSVDISRTWIAGDRTPTAKQRLLHDAASEQLERNLELFVPGASFAEISAKGHLPPSALHADANAAIAHGIGLCNEYPLILNRERFADGGYDGEVVEGMTLCVEALVAPPGGDEAVKLEEQILVTAEGPERLSSAPLDLAGAGDCSTHDDR